MKKEGREGGRVKEGERQREIEKGRGGGRVTEIIDISFDLNI